MDISFVLSESLGLIAGLSIFGGLFVAAAKLLRYRNVGLVQVFLSAILIVAFAVVDWRLVRQTGWLPAIPARLSFIAAFSLACGWLFRRRILTASQVPIGWVGGLKLGMVTSALLAIALPSIALLH